MARLDKEVPVEGREGSECYDCSAQALITIELVAFSLDILEKFTDFLKIIFLLSKLDFNTLINNTWGCDLKVMMLGLHSRK